MRLSDQFEERNNLVIVDLITETYFRNSAGLLGYSQVRLNSPNCQYVSVINSTIAIFN